MTEYEILRIIRFLEQVREPFQGHMPINTVDPTWNITLFLIKSHLEGSEVTISALVSISGVPYGTAMRRVHAMIDAGHIEKVRRSAGAKSFVLRPSQEFYRSFVRFAKDVKSVLANTFGFRSDEDTDEYYFGGADFAVDIRPPSPLREKLGHGVTEIKFLLHDDNYFTAMRNMWMDFRNRIASRQNFSLLDLPNLHDELRSVLNDTQSDYDVVTLNMPWLGEFARAGKLRPLDEFISHSSLKPLDFHPAVWTTGSWDDHQYGIPIYCTVEILAARSDWFEGAGLSYPRTFDQVIETGRELHDPKNGRFGIAWNAARGMPIATTFMVLMGCCGAPVLNLPRGRRHYQWATMRPEQLRPHILCDEGFQVLDYMHRLKEISPPDIMNFDWNRRIQAFLSGEVSMTYCWSMRAARFEYDVASVVKRRVAYLPQPKGPGGLSGNPVGGFLLAIPSNIPDDRAELAFQAISWMASPESMKLNVTSGLPVAPRFSVAADPEAAASSPIVRFVDRLSQRAMLCTWQRPPIPAYTRIEAVLGEIIHDALCQDISDRQALEKAQGLIDPFLK